MITTIDGRQIKNLIGKTYIEAFRSQKYVATNIVEYSRANGAEITYPGPTFTIADFAKLSKAQKAAKQVIEADAKATGYYKESRYAIVNKTASEKAIERMIERMNKAEAKRQAAATVLAGLQIQQF